MMQNDSSRQRSFVTDVLPWLLATAMMIAYLLTINPWISFFNLPQVAKSSGWVWTPELSAPAYYLVTLPLHWLPMRWIPLGLNLFSAVCAALVLLLLARSVALLPHDRTHDQRQRESSEFSILSIPLAWLPPFLAVAVCGFQLTFWEQATNGTGEMFDLLLFAYVVKSLLEFRQDGREARLLRAAFVCGIGMTNNFAMIGFLPAFILAILWIQGMSFFNLGFLTRMALCGLVGLLLYLLLPLIASQSAVEPVNFWLALKANLASQKNILVLFPKKTFVVLALTSLVPVLLISIRWPAQFGDNSPLGRNIATGMFHLIHAFLLLVCIWIAFDPPVSPRNKGLGLPFLTFYFLAAVSIGYFAGYFLLVFRSKIGRSRVFSPTLQNAERFATLVVFALLLIVLVGLPARNLPLIHLTNSPMVKNFAASLAAGLPGGGVVLSDDVRRLWLVQGWLARTGQDKDYIFLDTKSLRWPPYHKFLHQNYPEKWEAPPKDSLVEMYDAPSLMGQIMKLAADKPLYYLHPSFGYYFEIFYPEARGLVFEMKRYQPGKLLPPKPDDENVTLNENFWKEAEENTLSPMLASPESRTPESNQPWFDRMLQMFKIKRNPNVQTRLLATYYSRALNYWGVEMQKLNHLEAAASHFELALKLNPDNIVARINLEANKDLQEGVQTSVTFTKSIEESLGKYRSLEHVLNDNGPYDEPSLTYAQAWIFLQNKLYREAAQWLNRVTEFSKTDLPSRVAFGQISLMAKEPDLALDLVHEIRDNPERFPLNSTNRADLIALEAGALFAKTNDVAATALVESALASGQQDDYLLATISSLYLQRQDLSNALSLVEQRIKLNPTNTQVLVNKAYIQIQTGDIDGAIVTLNRAIELEPLNYMAIMNRAIALLRAGRLDESKVDYETLELVYPNMFQVQYGLAEIAWQQKDTNAAIRHYQSYLTNTLRTTLEAKTVAERLDQLKGVKPK